MPTTQIFKVELTDVLKMGVQAKEIEKKLQDICRDGLFVSVTDITESG